MDYLSWNYFILGGIKIEKNAKLTYFLLHFRRRLLQNFLLDERARCVHRRGHGEEQTAAAPSIHQRLAETKKKSLSIKLTWQL